MGGISRRPSPALFVSLFALFAALGGTAYAAGKINGKAIKVTSLPGNRLKPGSIPGNRLQPGAVGAANLAPNWIGGAQIDEPALGPVPNAVSAENARHAETAFQAENAVHAESAESAFDAQTGTQRGQRRERDHGQRPRSRLPAEKHASSPAPAGRSRRGLSRPHPTPRFNAPLREGRCRRRCSSPPSPNKRRWN